MPTIISETEHDNLVGRVGVKTPRQPAQAGEELVNDYHYTFKYRASAQKALNRLLENGAVARLED